MHTTVQTSKVLGFYHGVMEFHNSLHCTMITVCYLKINVIKSGNKNILYSKLFWQFPLSIWKLQCIAFLYVYVHIFRREY